MNRPTQKYGMDESKPNGEDENLLAGAGDAGNSTSTMQQVECDGNEESTGMHIVTEDDDSDEYTSLSEDDEDGSIAATHNQDHILTLVRKTNRKCDDLVLPKTVSLLTGRAGEKLYLIGTAHFSKESCEDVQKVINMVQPDAVVVELCSARTQILTVDEEELNKISDDSGFSQLKKCVRQKGLLSGLVIYAMMYMSAHITKQLGMPPGSEFRTAFQESRKVPGCRLYLGDRAIAVTLQRMLASLSFWQKIRFGLMLAQELKPISPEDVEKLKDQDIFEQLLQDMLEEFPHMAHVLVTERDLYISGFLQRVMKTPVYLPGQIATPPVVVGVFGIGHCNGIKAKFPIDISAEQLEEVQRVPPPSKMRKVLRYSVKGMMFLATIYSAYKLANWLDIYAKFKRWS